MDLDADPGQRSGIGLRVMSYNVHGQRNDPAAVAATIRAVEPDVVAIQEGPRRLRWRHLCADLAWRSELLYAAGGQPSLGNVVLVSHRVAVARVQIIRFPLTPGRHLRGAVLVRCSVGRTPFVVLATHLSTDALERPGQAAVLVEAMADLAAPLIVAADLNETSGGAAWRTIADGLVDTGAGAAAATFPAEQPRQRIDAIFVDARWCLRRHRVVATGQAARASDHLPVVADLWLPVDGGPE
jgi:endonuclease/exonuclease/phosphatase family metal-dependent hydrolase